jgi:hypothetical protein
MSDNPQNYRVNCSDLQTPLPKQSFGTLLTVEHCFNISVQKTLHCVNFLRHNNYQLQLQCSIEMTATGRQF